MPRVSILRPPTSNSGVGGRESLFVTDFIWEKRRLIGFKACNIMLGQKSSFARRMVEAEVAGKMLKVTEKTEK